MRMSKEEGQDKAERVCVWRESERASEQEEGWQCVQHSAGLFYLVRWSDVNRGEQAAGMRPEGGREGGSEGGRVLKWMNEKKKKKKEGEGALQSRLLSVREEEVSLALCSRHTCVNFRLFLGPSCTVHFSVFSPQTQFRLVN